MLNEKIIKTINTDIPEIRSDLADIENKNNKITINLNDFYTSDWNIAIDTALLFLKNNGGGKLFIPFRDDIIVNKCFYVSSNVTIYSNNALITQTSANRVFENENKMTLIKDSNISIFGLRFKNIFKVVNEKLHCLNFHNVDGLIISNNIIENFNGDGIYIGANSFPCSNVIVEYNKVLNYGRMGISITACYGGLIKGNYVRVDVPHEYNLGIDIEPNNLGDILENVTIINNVCENSSISCYAKSDFTINKITIENNKIINSDKSGISLTRVDISHIENNEIINSKFEGIVLFKCNKKSTISNNYISEINHTTSIKISECNGVDVISNTIDGTSAYGVNIIKSSNTTIDNNKIKNCISSVYLNSKCINSTISNNTITDVKTNAISILVNDDSVNGCENIIIKGNKCIDTTTSPLQKYGIRTLSLTNNCIVSENIVKGFINKKIELSGANNIDVNNL